MSRLILGQYEMLANLGSGSNGTVYKVRHHEQGYIRAIKILNGYVEDKNSTKYESFIHEYRTLTLLGNCSHPNIVSVHKADLLENKAFYEMDFIDGTPLANYIAAKQFLPLEEVIKCCRDLLSAMKYCHVGVTEYLYDREEDNISTDPKDGSKVLIDQATRERLIAKYGIVHNDIHSSNIIRNSMMGVTFSSILAFPCRAGKRYGKADWAKVPWPILPRKRYLTRRSRSIPMYIQSVLCCLKSWQEESHSHLKMLRGTIIPLNTCMTSTHPALFLPSSTTEKPPLKV